MQCRFSQICHLRPEIHEFGEWHCILHARVEKSEEMFARALEAHRKTSDDFRHFVFPTGDFSLMQFDRPVDFSDATFPPYAQFIGTNFTQAVDFSRANFTGETRFSNAKFRQKATFVDARFNGTAFFDGTVFSADAHFQNVAFAGPLYFLHARFTKMASFGGAVFSGSAEFLETTFGPTTSFCTAIFREPALFQGRSGALIFHGGEVDFRYVTSVRDTIVFRHADFRQCRLDATDCRSIEFTDVRWPREGGRTIIFDEIVLRTNPDERSHWALVERLYRELKQSHEDRRDYERAGDFHYGEKEMRRRNIDTPKGLRVVLFLYWLLSGYGERVLRPAIWTVGLFLYCAVVYTWGGLAMAGSDATLTFAEFPRALRYSFEAIFLLKPDDLSPQAPAGQWLRAIESVLGPLFLGLFALALRQRLRR